MTWLQGDSLAPPAPPAAAPKVAVESVVDQPVRWYFQPRSTFWVKSDDEGDADWVSLGPESFKLELMRRGYEDRVVAATGLKAWEIERLKTEKTRRVDYVGSLAGWRKGPVQFGDTLALVTRSPVLPTPHQGSYDTLAAVLDGILHGYGEEEGSVDQTLHFLAWWKHALRCLYEGKPSNGLAFAIAGEPGSGKTLLKDLVRVSFGGNQCQPYAWMVGEDGFNQELVASALWVIDDEGSSTRREDRLTLLTRIKEIVASSAIRFRDMQKTAISLAPFRRLFFCLNIEPERLLVLPPMDPDIEDKIMILKAYKGPMPMPTNTIDQREAFWAKMMEELPCLVYDLLRTPLPGVEEGRFGSKTFHHPQIMRELSDVGPEIVILDFIDRLAARQDNETLPTWPTSVDSGYLPCWTGTTAELRQLLLSESSPLSVYDKKEVPKPVWIGRRLEALSKRYPRRFVHKRSAQKNFWQIYKTDPALQPSGGMEE